MTLLLKNDPRTIERYRRYHARPWPEVIARLREVGVTTMKIYLTGSRLFLYMEAVDGFDPERDFPKLGDLPRYREWDQLMRTMQQRAPEARHEEWWARMDEVFNLDKQ